MTKRVTYIVLGVFLILTGLANFVSFSALGTINAILAIAAGILILVSTPGISIRWGWFIAAVYLILLGLLEFVSIGFSGMGTVMAILAIAAGIILLVRTPGFRHHIGFLLFCVWLILVGLTGLVSIGELGVVVAIVAIASGVLMIANE